MPPINSEEYHGVTIPGFILQLSFKKDKVTPEDKFILALIHYLPETPNNEFLSWKINCGKTEESMQQHITKLIKLGHVTYNGRKRKHKKLEINVPRKIISRHYKKGIYIDDILMSELETCSQRLVAATEFGFRRASEKWKFTKIGMSRRAYLYNKNLIVDTEKYEKIRLKKQPSNKKVLCHEDHLEKCVNHATLEPVFKAGVYNGLEPSLSRLETRSSLGSLCSSEHKLIATSQTISNRLSRSIERDKGGTHKKMCVPLEAMDKGGRFYNNHLNIVKESSKMTSKQITSLRKSKIAVPVKRKDTRKKLTKPSAEMMMIFNNYPLLTRHRIGTSSHRNTEKVIRGLKNGLHTEFGEYMNCLIRKGEVQKLKPSEIKLAMHKKYSLKERKEIYQRLNDLLTPGFWPQKKNHLPRNLYDALAPDSKFRERSWLLYLIIKNTSKLKRTAIKRMEWEVGEIVEACPRSGLENEIPELKQCLTKLNRWYYKVFLAPYYDKVTVIGGQWGTWRKFLKGLLGFIEEHYGSLRRKTPGWFHPNSRVVKSWVREMERFSKEIEKQQTLSPWVEEKMREYDAIEDKEQRELAW